MGSITEEIYKDLERINIGLNKYYELSTIHALGVNKSLLSHYDSIISRKSYWRSFDIAFYNWILSFFKHAISLLQSRW